MKILAFDTETTGVFQRGLPSEDFGNPFACSLAYQLFDDNAGLLLESFYELVKPQNWPFDEVPAEALAIHKLNRALLEQKGKPVGFVAEKLAKAMEASEGIIGFNVDFDLKISRGMFKRLGMPDLFGHRQTFCLMHGTRELCGIAPTNAMMGAGLRVSKSPKLHEAVELLLHKRIEGAHNALVDVDHTRQLHLHVKKNHPSAIKWKRSTPNTKSQTEIDRMREQLAAQGFTVTGQPASPIKQPDDDIF